MSTLPIPPIVTRQAAERMILSARPGAPVVPEPRVVVRPSRLAGSRRTLSSALHRAGDRVAPSAYDSAA